MRRHETDAGDWLEQDDSVTTADTPPMAFPAGAWRHSQASRPRCQPTRTETDRCPDIGHGAFFVMAPKPAKTSRTAAVSLATNSARDASLHRKPPAGGSHRAACRTRPGQEVFCCLITVLSLVGFTRRGRDAVGGGWAGDDGHVESAAVADYPRSDAGCGPQRGPPGGGGGAKHQLGGGVGVGEGQRRRRAS